MIGKNALKPRKKTIFSYIFIMTVSHLLFSSSKYSCENGALYFLNLTIEPCKLAIHIEAAKLIQHDMWQIGWKIVRSSIVKVLHY